MRSGATQQSPTASPKVTATISADVHTSEGGGGNDRLVSVRSDEQVWGGQYIIELDNSDEALNAKDYKGSELTLNIGFTNEAGSNLAPLYVHNQTFISREGKLLLLLNCIDAWGLLSQVNSDLAGSAYNQEWQQEANLLGRKLPSGETIPQTLIDQIKVNYGKVIYTIITELIDTIGKTVVMAAGDNDGIISARQPPINIRNPIQGVRNLLDMTKCYLLWRTEAGVGKFRVIKPDAHSIVYSYSISNLFFSNVEDAAVVIPNKVTFWSLNLAGTDWISGTPAVDSDSYTKLGVYINRHYLLANMQIDARANAATLTALAEGALAKIQGERSQGMLIAPMHCSQELFDKISIVDNRYTTPKTTTGYVHRIIREYDRGVYRISIQLGGVTSGYTPPGGGIPTPLAEAELPRALDWRIVAWETLLPKAIQGYQHNITFTSIDWNTVSWGSGTIRFYDDTTQAVLAGNTGNLADAAIRYIYFDLADANPNILKVTTDYLSVMTEKTGMICLVQRGSSTGIKATFIPSYGKEPLITPDFIDMTGIKAYTYPDGTRIQGIFNTQIQAGRILLSAATYFASGYDPTGKEVIVHRGTSAPADTSKLWFNTTIGVMKAYIAGAWKVMEGEWYRKTGVAIDATKGIALYGGQVSFRTYPTLNDYLNNINVQCYVGTDGKLYAGGGAIVMDSTKLQIDGAKLILRKSDGTSAGYLYIDADGYLRLDAWSRIKSKTLVPVGTFESIGSDAERWIASYVKTGYCEGLSSLSPHKGLNFPLATHFTIPHYTTITSPRERDFAHDLQGAGRLTIYSNGAWRDNA